MITFQVAPEGRVAVHVNVRFAGLRKQRGAGVGAAAPASYGAVLPGRRRQRRVSTYILYIGWHCLPP